LNPKPFEYHAPKSLEEAASIFERYGTDAKVLAGGQSLIPLMKLRLVSPAHLIDLGRIGGLSYIRVEGGELAIGAMTRMAEIARSDLVNKECPMLRQCALGIGDAEVRNMGTIGGNLSHADPTNDMPAVMVATGASLVAFSRRGRRTLPASGFFLDTFATALAEGEILSEVRIPAVRGRGGAYLKLERQAGDFAIAGVAVALELTPDGVCTYCGIGLTSVGPKVIRATRAENLLKGSKLEKAKIESAAEKAVEEAEPNTDLRGTADYKRAMVRVLTGRAITEAMGRAGRR